MSNEFNDMQLSNKVLEALKLLEYKNPTDVQKAVIPRAMCGENIIVKSQTGTGKTAAFAIPVCENVVWEENRPSALVLEPTRELSVQVKQEIFNIGRLKKIKVADVFGGFPIDKQILTLKQKTHVVVGTPGRIMDHLRRSTLDLTNISILVIDEADLMLDMGFEEEVSEIIENITRVKDNIQIMLFSATINENVARITEKYMKESAQIFIEGENTTLKEITSKLYLVDSEDKYKQFKKIIISENPEKCMVFCGTREMVNVLFRKLKRDKVRCGMIHGEMEQRDRLRSIEEFRENRFPYLIATDVAARGIDFENITHVINYDFPTGRETYVHRMGRTGRNGKSGIAISILTNENLKMKKMVEEFIGETIEFEQDDIHISKGLERKFEEKQKEKIKSKPGRSAKLNRDITRLSIGGGRKSKMRPGDIVGTLCSIEGITMDDIGIIDVRDSISFVEILNGKGNDVLLELQHRTIKGKERKVRKVR